jgi:hypothetical protein
LCGAFAECCKAGATAENYYCCWAFLNLGAFLLSAVIGQGDLYGPTYISRKCWALRTSLFWWIISWLHVLWYDQIACRKFDPSWIVSSCLEIL